jgi:acetate kinase
MAGENDFRELQRMVDAGDAAARLAFDVYCYRIRKYVGSYTAVLGRVDAIVFTAGVGQHSPSVRAASLAGLETMGVEVDGPRNDAATGREPAMVSTRDSRVAVMVVPTNEEWEIARQALAVVQG